MSNPCIVEALARGKRRCTCLNVRLVVSLFEVPNERPYSSNPFKNLAMSAIHGIRYGQPKRGWQACCTQCDKLYLATSGVRSRAELRRQIQAAGMEEAA